jgi:hypothetical protein
VRLVSWQAALGLGVRFVTLNSVYELDPNRRRLRRVSVHAPQGGAAHQTGATWRNYVIVSPVREGAPVTIVWRVEPAATGTIWRTTITSRVVAILN